MHDTTAVTASPDTDTTPPRTKVVLDTSVLIADPDAVSGFVDSDVVLPLTVVEELDGLKARTDEVGVLARTALRGLEERRAHAGGTLAGSVSVGDNSTLRIEINGIQRHLLTEHGLDPGKPDNRIIGAALGLAGSGPVTVVSNDAALRVKAAHLGLTAVEHAPAANEPSGPGWVTVETGQDLIDDLFTRRHLSRDDLDPDIAAALPPGNAFAVFKSGSGSALARLRSQLVEALPQQSPSPWGLRPRSKEQRFALELLLDPTVPVVALDGPAGTGKSLLAIAAGLELAVEQGSFDRLSVFKPLVPVGREEVGFLPGDLSEKVQPYFAAFFDSVTALTDRRSVRDAEKVVTGLLAAGKLSLEPVTFLRGRSLASSFLIVDEATNLERPVLKTLLTRVSEGTKIVFTGDVSQIDNPFASERNNALSALISAFTGQDIFGHVRLVNCERSAVASLAAGLL